jgi:hypothetical protein
MKTKYIFGGVIVGLATGIILKQYFFKGQNVSEETEGFDGKRGINYKPKGVEYKFIRQNQGNAGLFHKGDIVIGTVGQQVMGSTMIDVIKNGIKDSFVLGYDVQKN